MSDIRIYYEDGINAPVDGHGNEAVEMDVDNEAFPLGDITNYNTYVDRKPPERELTALKEKKIKNKKNVPKTEYNSYTDKDKARFFILIYDHGMNPNQAWKAHGHISRTTAYRWYAKDQKKVNKEIEDDEEPVKRAGRPKILNEDHTKHLKLEFEDNPSVTIEQAHESLVKAFSGLTISQTTIYNYMTNDLALTFKKAHFHSKERNSPENIQNRYDWVVKWSQTDMDYMSNCVFIDESAFHINLKRTMAWSEKGTRAEVPVPQTRAKTTTIIGATSVWGVLNVQVRLPGTSNKKRKLAGTSSGKATTTVGTVTGHYFNFIAKTIDIMDQHEQFKDFYLVMDNAPIHTAKDIERYIIQRGYRCVYLPPYSPELNPIEQFWHVVKSKLKRERLLKTETLSTRITDACNDVLYSDLEGSARYSVKKFDVCLAKEPL
ncbi:ribosomal protein S5 [Mucor velutinosus]|uniref:DNA-directed RNA polymerases I, II, and III subunit RPABC3 n=1 Tax=Mucor velutinosus TaxID=708070 RepID=A0AAN7HKL6_9FUNG|nr:DNA-directed RNA polymerases I, II, and III subunit RPABC3 [Mucor velutinosus]KAK4511354.1 ribosomal protein S5 [Mucor velutinosus]